ncbi:hypothetical protein FE275_05385 [Pseudomonas koreensis]|nr:hypothetical protein FE275_05385 [Pseudomonas koreensis]
MPRRGCGRWWSGARASSKGSEIFAGYQALFASRLAPTENCVSATGPMWERACSRRGHHWQLMSPGESP